MATPSDTKVLLDVMLGELRSLLRMLGYDTAYAMERGVEDDDAVAAIARREGRVLLTRDEALARQVDDSVMVRPTDTDEALSVLAAAGFDLELTEPRRCSACNGQLRALDPGEDTPEYAPDPTEFRCWECRNCGQLFWKGSHWDAVRERLRRA
ncbi:MAG: Mut7-C RNAse domain-containing protein [Halanaeroarchaeum sp.]